MVQLGTQAEFFIELRYAGSLCAGREGGLSQFLSPGRNWYDLDCVLVRKKVALGVGQLVLHLGNHAGIADSSKIRLTSPLYARSKVLRVTETFGIAKKLINSD